MPMTEPMLFERDLQDARDVLSDLRRSLSRRLENETLIVISAGEKSEAHLARTVPKLARQLAATGRTPRFVIGFNAGYAPASLLERLEAAKLHVRRAESHRTSAVEPGPVLGLDGQPPPLATSDEPSCLAIYQRATPEALGKIRMLGDIYAWLQARVEVGDGLPATLIACDAESEFHAPDCDLTDSDHDCLPLGNLIAQATEQCVGTRNLFRCYTDRDSIQVPTGQRISGIHEFVNFIHGRAVGFQWLPGGGTAGPADAMIALKRVLTRLPGLRVEDVALSVLAEGLEINGGVSREVFSLNRCAPAGSRSSRQQMMRWIAGYRSMQVRYAGAGSPLESVTSPTLPKIVWQATRLSLRDAVSADSWRGRLSALHRYFRMTATLPLFVYIMSAARPDDLEHGQGHWPSP